MRHIKSLLEHDRDDPIYFRSLFRGDHQAKEHNAGNEVLYYSDNPDAAETYGPVTEVKDVTVERPYVVDFGHFPQEYNEVYSFMESLEISFVKAVKTGKDQVSWYYQNKHVIPGDTDGIVVRNIVDVADGHVDADPEEDEHRYQRLVRKYVGTTVLLYNRR